MHGSPVFAALLVAAIGIFGRTNMATVGAVGMGRVIQFAAETIVVCHRSAASHGARNTPIDKNLWTSL